MRLQVIRLLGALVSFCLISCGSDSSELPEKGKKSIESSSEPGPKIVLCIGEDVSLSTQKQLLRIGETELRRIGSTLLERHFSGEICFKAVGSPSGQTYQRIGLESIQKTPAGATILAKAKLKKENEAISDKNKAALEAFYAQCKSEIKKADRSMTDLNGFLEQMNVVFGSSGLPAERRFLLLSTDGKQDTKASKQLNRSLFEKSGATVLICGWDTKKKEISGAEHFGLPEQAVDRLLVRLKMLHD